MAAVLVVVLVLVLVVMPVGVVAVVLDGVVVIGAMSVECFFLFFTALM